MAHRFLAPSLKRTRQKSKKDLSVFLIEIHLKMFQQTILTDGSCPSASPKRPSFIPMGRLSTSTIRSATTTICLPHPAAGRSPATALRDPPHPSGIIWDRSSYPTAAGCGRGFPVKSARSWKSSFGSTPSALSSTGGRI